MNEQTVFVSFPGSSTLEFQSIQCVPVYEPSSPGWVDLYYTANTLTLVNHSGDVERINFATGCKERWYVRPHLSSVVTMRTGGYYFQFGGDGSIRYSCKAGTCYWGPIRTDILPEEDEIGFYTVCETTVADGDLRDMHRWLLWEHDDDTMSIADPDPAESIAALEAWREGLKARSGNAMADTCLQVANREIARLKDEGCPECRRSGVCMCYT